jgi:uncharacterized protein (DUF362 family)
MVSTTKAHPIYSQDATVYLALGDDRFKALQQAMDVSNFLDNVEAVRKTSGKSHADFFIVLKPNLMTASIRQDRSPVYTDPELVEYLFGQLRQHGFQRMAIAEARNVYDYSYQGRSVEAVADMVGYSEAHGYAIEDLTEQTVPYYYGGVLGRHAAGRAWVDADYRISFAKNKTHWQCLYTGCLKNIYGCLPEWDKMKHYHGKGREFSECCILILEAFPVRFGFLDAWVSGDGFSGHVRDAKPNHTKTIFASENILALDWVMGEKMGLDPEKNFVIKEALRRWEMPQITRQGDMTAWHPWTNVRPLTVGFLDVAEEAYWTSRFFSRVLASQQDERFPPVSRWQWLFSVLQGITRLVERLFVTKT